MSLSLATSESNCILGISFVRISTICFPVTIYSTSMTHCFCFLGGLVMKLQILGSVMMNRPLPCLWQLDCHLIL